LYLVGIQPFRYAITHSQYDDLIKKGYRRRHDTSKGSRDSNQGSFTLPKSVSFLEREVAFVRPPTLQ
jgi:hypothetical protein